MKLGHAESWLNDHRPQRAGGWRGGTEARAAAGTSQPAISAYESGRRSPTLDTVERLAASVGLEMTIDFHPRMTREERRSLRLHEAIARRLLKEPEAGLAKARRTLRLMRGRHPHAHGLLDEWAHLLERPIPELVRRMTDRDPQARELRHVTPFAGILSAAERREVYRAFRRAEGVD